VGRGGGAIGARHFRRALALLVGLPAVLSAGAALAAGCAADRIDLRGPWGAASFTVEVADEPQERAVGLMNRTEMAPSHGMLFVYERPQRATFWMRNTLIPLDMIFADARGVVTKVHERAQPLDERVIDGGRDVAFVLEVNAGLASRLGVAPGTQLRHPAIGQGAWPCDGTAGTPAEGAGAQASSD